MQSRCPRHAENCRAHRDFEVGYAGEDWSAFHPLTGGASASQRLSVVEKATSAHHSGPIHHLAQLEYRAVPALSLHFQLAHFQNVYLSPYGLPYWHQILEPI